MFTICQEPYLKCIVLFNHHTNIKVDIIIIAIREIWKLRRGEVQQLV